MQLYLKKTISKNVLAITMATTLSAINFVYAGTLTHLTTPECEGITMNSSGEAIPSPCTVEPSTGNLIKIGDTSGPVLTGIAADGYVPASSGGIVYNNALFAGTDANSVVLPSTPNVAAIVKYTIAGSVGFSFNFKVTLSNGAKFAGIPELSLETESTGITLQPSGSANQSSYLWKITVPPNAPLQNGDAFYMAYQLTNAAPLNIPGERIDLTVNLGHPLNGNIDEEVINVAVSQFATNCATVTEIPQAECQALVDLYESTNGPNWRYIAGWNVTNTPCSWPRISCTGGHVTRLELNNHQLSGSIPESLGNLSYLQILVLINNQLTGSIPKSLSNLNHLQILSLYNNQLSGSIPELLGNLGNLRFFYLNNNQLSGSIPESIGNLSQLSRLHLNNNQLSGDIPISLMNLKVRHLRIDNNYLVASDSELINWLDQKNPGWATTQTPSYNLTLKKTDQGRSTLKAKKKGEADWNLVCQWDCTDTSELYPPDSQVILTAIPEPGFIFSGWTGDCTSTENRLTLTMNATKNCTAQFELDNDNIALLTVNTTGNAQGSIITQDSYINCGDTCSAHYPLDKRVALEATTNTDNLFIGWTGDCTGFNPQVSVTMDEAKNCTATFNTKPTGALTLSVEKLGEGRGIVKGRMKGEDNTIDCTSICQQSSYDYQAGDQVILSANPLEGFIFTEWGGDCTGTETNITVLMAQVNHCTAQFDLDPNLVWHQLTVNLGGTGNGSIKASGLNCTQTSCTVYYPQNDTVKLRAIPTLFSQFVGWTGNCEGIRTVELTITEDLTCTAEFKSLFEIAAETITDVFLMEAMLETGQSVTAQYPGTEDNQAALKEAFWLGLQAIMQVDQHLKLSTTQAWPTQFDRVEWLPDDADNLQYTQSIQIIQDEFLDIQVWLSNQTGTTELVSIVIYYGHELPVLDDGSGTISNRIWFWRGSF